MEPDVSTYYVAVVECRRKGEVGQWSHMATFDLWKAYGIGAICHRPIWWSDSVGAYVRREGMVYPGLPNNVSREASSLHSGAFDAYAAAVSIDVVHQLFEYKEDQAPLLYVQPFLAYCMVIRRGAFDHDYRVIVMHD